MEENGGIVVEHVYKSFGREHEINFNSLLRYKETL